MSIEGDKFRTIHRALGNLSFKELADLLDKALAVEHAQVEWEKRRESIMAEVTKLDAQRQRAHGEAVMAEEKAKTVAGEIQRAATEAATEIRAKAEAEAATLRAAAKAEAAATVAEAKEQAAKIKAGLKEGEARLATVAAQITAEEQKLAALKAAIAKITGG